MPILPSYQTTKSLETERIFAQKLGAQAQQTQKELKAALQASADLASLRAALQGDLEVRRLEVGIHRRGR